LSTAATATNSNTISITKLIHYVLLFFIPLMISMVLSLVLSRWSSPMMGITVQVGISIWMIPFTTVIFLFIIPYIRERENIQGIRFALLAFMVVGLSFAMPSVVKGMWSILFIEFTYLATYIMLTFIYCPEVLGMNRNITLWFKHHRQFIIIVVYLSIVLFYVFGFGRIYYQMHVDCPEAFTGTVNADYGDFIYFSMITFASIGYGDITPVITGARIVVIIQAILGMIINVMFIAILLLFISNFQAMMMQEEKAIVKEEKIIMAEEEREAHAIEQLKKRLPKGYIIHRQNKTKKAAKAKKGAKTEVKKKAATKKKARSKGK